MDFDKYKRLKENMIRNQLIARGISDSRVLEAFHRIERHHFVDEGFEQKAYEDSALPISSGQTISQPFMVAYMTELLTLSGTERVLEIGTGSGFQASILACLGCDVYTIERHQSLYLQSQQRFTRLGLSVKGRLGDGTLGWPDLSGFDRIIVTAGAPEIPKHLCEQLNENGFMLIPVGKTKEEQTLLKISKKENTFYKETYANCAFVPLIGKDGWS